MLTILFDGIAYGMLLFVLACGLAVTLGLMNFVNLAHGSFAMAGGYITLILVNRNGVPFFAALPLAFVITAALGAAFERSTSTSTPSRISTRCCSPLAWCSCR
jgi:branched-chain amino acid transport system permease protein